MMNKEYHYITFIIYVITLLIINIILLLKNVLNESRGLAYIYIYILYINFHMKEQMVMI